MSSRRAAFKRSYSSNLDIASRQSSCLVFEFGTAYFRVGIAGEPKPRHVFDLSPSKNKLEMQLSSSEYWISLPSLPVLLHNSNQENSSYLSLGPWLSNLYSQHLLLKPRSRRVMIILPIYHPLEFRTVLESVLLNDLQVPSVSFVDSFRTIPYAIGGSSSGVIVDIGYVEGRVACFFDGEMCENTLQIVPVGFQSLLSRIEDSKSSDANESSGSSNVKEFIQEMYFDLSNTSSLIYAFLSSLLKCPIDLRRMVIQNVVFVGGGVEAISQFEQRFVQCVKKLFEKRGNATDQPLLSGRIQEREKFSPLEALITTAPLSVLHPLRFRPAAMAWVGGSIMASIKTNRQKWTDRIDQKKP